jgi:hypothetical protein
MHLYLKQIIKMHDLKCISIWRGTHFVEENKKYQCISSFPLKTVHMQISC